MPNNYYYDEKYVSGMLLEYQRTIKIQDDRLIYKDKKLEHDITIEVLKIVSAIIYTYNYQYFEPYLDLIQHGVLNCLKNYHKFAPSKGTSYNLFSKIAKVSLMNYTTRKKKHRNHQNIDDQLELHAHIPADYDLLMNNLEDTLFDILDHNYLGDARKKYIKVASLLLRYFRSTKKFISKSDLYAFCRSYGVRQNVVREFIHQMQSYSVQIFENV